MSDENEVTQEKPKAAGLLSEGATKKVDGWFEQIKAKKVRISRKAFLSWYIESAPEALTNGELSAIVARFYDPEAHLKQMLKEVRKAKQDGQPPRSLEFIVKERRPIERVRTTENASLEASHENAPAANDQAEMES